MYRGFLLSLHSAVTSERRKAVLMAEEAFLKPRWRLQSLFSMMHSVGLVIIFSRSFPNWGVTVMRL